MKALIGSRHPPQVDLRLEIINICGRVFAQKLANFLFFSKLLYFLLIDLKSLSQGLLWDIGEKLIFTKVTIGLQSDFTVS